VQVLRPPQKFERPPFWNWGYWIKKYGEEITFSGTIFLLNFMKINRLVIKVLVWDRGQTDTVW
jgi:hypothetical protein